MINLSTFGCDPITRVKQACQELRAGKAIILVDDEDRENEGDLIFSTTKLTVKQVNTLIQDCSGIICLCLNAFKAKSLGLKPMVENNQSKYQTAFTNSIESKENITTGVSAHDRWITIKTASRTNSNHKDIVQPGHIFPLVAKDGGVLSRRGHTEGSIDLMEISNLEPTAVLCELMNKDGTMKKNDQLMEYAHLNNLMILSVNDIYEYKSQNVSKTMAIAV